MLRELPLGSLLLARVNVHRHHQHAPASGAVGSNARDVRIHTTAGFGNNPARTQSAPVVTHRQPAWP